jgi:hypothetical protein
MLATALDFPSACATLILTYVRNRARHGRCARAIQLARVGMDAWRGPFSLVSSNVSTFGGVVLNAAT